MLKILVTLTFIISTEMSHHTLSFPWRSLYLQWENVCSPYKGISLGDSPLIRGGGGGSHKVGITF